MSVADSDPMVARTTPSCAARQLRPADLQLTTGTAAIAVVIITIIIIASVDATANTLNPVKATNCDALLLLPKI
jgi:hypothetical protein